jgi:hypothetical protein
MKNNTERSKQFLSQAIQSMPDDFALSTARQQMRSALNEIQKVESKREKREEVNQQAVLDSLENKIMYGTPYDAKAALKAIDELIGLEKSNLRAIQERRKQIEKPEDGDEDLQALLG